MRIVLVTATVVVAVVAGLLLLRGLARRFRRLRRLDRAWADVIEAMADGRLAAATGEALLQHLEGLRRACIRVREG